MNKRNNKITFVTSNTAKFQKIKKWIEELDPKIAVEQVKIDLPEYQSLNQKKVALAKAKEAFKILKKPLIIDDGGIYLEQYNNFPGPLAKYVFEGIGFKGLWKLAKDNPRTYFKVLIVYIDEINSYEFFEGICYGSLIEPKNDEIDLNLPYTNIFVPDGYTKTLAELSGTEDEKVCDHRAHAIRKFVSWYVKKTES